jgi:hypothetical protein
VFLLSLKKGTTQFRKIELTRNPGNVTEDDISKLFAKADRIERTNLSTWLGPYLDDTPIAQATYTIRWWLYNAIPRFTNEKDPLNAAWKVISPLAIELIEFVMDVRKNNFTKQQINYYMGLINSAMKEIRAAQESGDWFAKTITTGSVIGISDFLDTFPNLESYIKTVVTSRV